MPQYFLCYRRDDTAGHAGRLYGDLVREFDEEAIFFDLRSVPAGEDFREVVRSSIAASSVVLVLIGRNWQPELLHDPHDYVRHEIEDALASGKRVVPVLVQGTPMPEPQQLPEPIRQLAYRNASEISDRHWDADVKSLIRVLRPRRRLSPMLLGAAAAIVAVVLAVVAMTRRDKPQPQIEPQTATVTTTQPETTTTAVVTQPPPTTTTAPPTVTATLVNPPLVQKYPKPGTGIATNPLLFPFGTIHRNGGVVDRFSVAAGSRISIRTSPSASIAYRGRVAEESLVIASEEWTSARLEKGVSMTADPGAAYDMEITITRVPSRAASLEVLVTVAGKESRYTLLPARVPMTYKWRVEYR